MEQEKRSVGRPKKVEGAMINIGTLRLRPEIVRGLDECLKKDSRYGQRADVIRDILANAFQGGARE